MAQNALDEMKDGAQIIDARFGKNSRATQHYFSEYQKNARAFRELLQEAQSGGDRTENPRLTKIFEMTDTCETLEDSE